MDIHKAFHMNGGIDDNSYSKNSSLQKSVAEKVKHITGEAIEEVYITKKPKRLGIADLGCSSGPNTLSNIKHIVDVVQKASRVNSLQEPEFRVYLNDLPTNDFNTIFRALPEFYRDIKRGGTSHPPLYVAGCPGTFYGRLFPDESLHFVYSSNSLHWLSRVPLDIYEEQGSCSSSMNKRSIYISERSPPEVKKAYLKQFRQDFSLFLQSRSPELVDGGRMVLILLGRVDSDHHHYSSSCFWELFYQSLAYLVAQGDVEEEKLESYEVHFYAPSKEELEEELRKEGSFKTEMVKIFETDQKEMESCRSYGAAVAKAVRSIQESMLVSHFGFEVDGLILDKLFNHYAFLIHQESAKRHLTSINTLLVLSKLSTK